MKLSKKSVLTGLAAAVLLTGAVLPSPVLAASRSSVSSPWAVQVDKVEPGSVNIAPAFRIAIYENLVKELGKRNQFKQVLRSGDRNADGTPDLLILKTTLASYTEGSETRRAVTTFSGATKVKVRTELYTRGGQMVLKREINGTVRFFGDNLRATHNLARNVANAIEHSPLPEPTDSTSNNQTSELSR